MSSAPGTRALIDELVAGMAAGAVESVPLGELLDRFRERAFGLFLLVGVLPAFLPLPAGAGAISGPLVMLAGLQLLCLAGHPWLPGWLQRRPVRREALAGFRRRLARPLGWLERVSAPRWPQLFDALPARLFNGALLLVLGLLLALPLPLTNYPFGLVLVVFAVALIERDGRMLALAWGLGCAQLLLVALFADQAWAGIEALAARLAA